MLSGGDDGLIKLWDLTMVLADAHLPNPDPNPNPNPNPDPNPANPNPNPNPNQGKLLHEFTLHTSAITALAIHPCEFLMASASADRTVRLWDLETFEPVCCT